MQVNESSHKQLQREQKRALGFGPSLSLITDEGSCSTEATQFNRFLRESLCYFVVSFHSTDNFDSSISDSEMGGDDVLLDGNCYIATTNYTRQAQDELSMTKGQAVYVVDDSDKSK